MDPQAPPRPSPTATGPRPKRRPPPRRTAPSLHVDLSHCLVERRRRHDMNSLLTTLQSLLPPATKKRGRSKCAILTDSIRYISVLQEQIEELARKKAEIANKPVSLANGAVNSNALNQPTSADPLPVGNSSINRSGWSKVEVCPDERNIFIAISTSNSTGLLSGALLSMQNYHLDVLSACLSTNAQLGFLSIHAERSRDANEVAIEKLRDELLELAAGSGESGGKKSRS